MTFQREDDFLQSIDAQDQFGSEGLRLRLAADVAGDVSASLVTMDLAAGFPLALDMNLSTMESDLRQQLNRYKFFLHPKE